jgi:hypothetical protein
VQALGPSHLSSERGADRFRFASATAKDAQATGWTLVILARPAERLADMVWSGKATKAAPIGHAQAFGIVGLFLKLAVAD